MSKELICFIPSKGRPTTKTHLLFEEVGIKVLHFVEPQELKAYSKKENVISIEQNDKGIGYAKIIDKKGWVDVRLNIKKLAKDYKKQIL